MIRQHPEIGSEVTVVIVTYNSAAVIGGLIDSLPAGLDGVTAKVVVVDNGSSDDTVELVRAVAPWAVIIATGSNGGYARGINIGVDASPPTRGVLVLNPDVRLEDGCVRQLLEVLERTGAGMVAPKLRDAHGDLIYSQRREPTLRRALADLVLGAERAGRIGTLGELVTDARAYEAPCVVDWAEGSTLMISTDCWNRVGPWDESFFLYSEETEYALRARDAGWACRFEPTAHAVHLEGGSAHTPALWRLLIVNKWRLYRKRHGPWAGRAYWGVLTLRETTRAILGRRTARAAVQGLTDRRFLSERPGPHSLRY